MAAEATLLQVRSEMWRHGGLTVCQECSVKLHNPSRSAMRQETAGQVPGDGLDRHVSAAQANEKVEIVPAVTVGALRARWRVHGFPKPVNP
jgi:hypothetical protein